MIVYMTNIFKNLYQYRELLKTSVKKEVRGKYKNSFLGVLWSFLNPLLQIIVYAIVFPLILNNKQENYVIFLCCGLIPWTFFATAINRSAFSFLENGNGGLGENMDDFSNERTDMLTPEESRKLLSDEFMLIAAAVPEES